jgi:hypothetical protein
VHSSTSSSSTPFDRAPSRPWIRILAAAALLYGTTAVGLELLWRSRGIVPTVADSMDLWAAARERARAITDQRLVVLAGDSRMRLGFDTETFARRFPGYLLVNLAIEDNSPLPVVRDLALDQRFCGLLIVQIVESYFLVHQGVHMVAQRYVDHYWRSWRVSLDRRVDTALSAWLTSHLVLLQSHTSLKAVLSGLAYRRRLPGPSEVRTLPDRSRSMDFRYVNDVPGYLARNLRDARADVAPPGYGARDWERDVSVARPWIEMIRRRGGQVVFVRTPEAASLRAIEEQAFPRAENWDRVSGQAGAPTLHGDEFANVAELAMPDGVHLDVTAKAAFTSELLDMLIRNGNLPEHL